MNKYPPPGSIITQAQTVKPIKKQRRDLSATFSMLINSCSFDFFDYRLDLCILLAENQLIAVLVKVHKNRIALHKLT